MLNIFNMALCGVLAGYLPYSWFRRSRWKYHAVFAGGVLSVLSRADCSLWRS